jgi:hypothetical protein
MARKFFRTLFISIITLMLFAGVAAYFMNEPVPSGVSGSEADQLALKMEGAINKQAWNEIRWVSWTFPGDKTYIWDKYRQFLQMEWGGKRVVMNLTTREGKAWQENQAVSGNTAAKFIKSAWQNFCNDSFWFIAPAKTFDRGVKRELVRLPGGGEALKVVYESGGVTPGDIYLWELEKESNLPKSCKMWVKILPIGGIKSTWGNWVKLPGGAKIAGVRNIGPLKIEISDIKCGNSYRDCGLSQDPFYMLKK